MIKVLFVCVHNSARSQIAEELLKKFAPDIFSVESAGLEPGNINPYVVEILKEDGIDIYEKKTNSVFDFFRQVRKYNYVISVCSESEGSKCPIFPGITKRIHWSFEDPSVFKGTQEEILNLVRSLKDRIKESVLQFIKEHGDGV
ncbi:arsenate reductase ArsC [candidate division WOR-3 bacterium]|nr:arsenate reductase ArsC [candidate division WOR-3 bacterium]